MASYAPLLAKENFTQWRTDLIFFTNTNINLTPSYEVQKLYGQNSGDMYINSKIELSDQKDAVRKRVGVSIVKQSNTGDIIIKLANLLPVEVNMELNIDGLENKAQEVSKTVLTGRPEDKYVTPKTTDINMQEIKNHSLHAYSFTLIRIKAII
jgi:alpha-L-arabinofuranosidase